MKFRNLIFSGSLAIAVMISANEKAKSAHQHKTKHDGKMLMIGDVHFEVTGNEKMIMVYYFDKFGDELATSKIDVTLELVEGSKRQNLKFDKDKNAANLIHVSLPKELNKNVAEIIIKAKNVDLPKGQVVGGTIAKIAIRDLKTEVDPHAGHNM